MKPPSRRAKEWVRRYLVQWRPQRELAAMLDTYADECMAEDRARILVMLQLAAYPEDAPHAAVLREFADILKQVR